MQVVDFTDFLCIFSLVQFCNNLVRIVNYTSYRPGEGRGRDDMVPPPMAVRLAADLRPSADGPYSLGWDRQTDRQWDRGIA